MAAPDNMAAARDARAARVALRHALADGTLKVDQLLAFTVDQQHQDAAAGMTIGDILAASPQTRHHTMGIALAGGLPHLNVRLRDLAHRSRTLMAIHIRKDTP